MLCVTGDIKTGHRVERITWSYRHSGRQAARLMRLVKELEQGVHLGHLGSSPELSAANVTLGKSYCGKYR